MEIDSKQVRHLAVLANLEFSPDELRRFTNRLNQVLRYMEKLDELNLEGTKPTISSLETDNPALRDDRVLPSVSPEEALRNAPSTDRNQFLVPKVLP